VFCSAPLQVPWAHEEEKHTEDCGESYGKNKDTGCDRPIGRAGAPRRSLNNNRYRPKSGRPREYDEDSTTEIIKVASARPKDLGLKFTTWSLQKLEEYLKKRPGLKKVTRSTIRRRLQTEGFKFKAGQTWCESNDPDFEVKKTKS